MTCHEIESLLPSFVDGDAPPGDMAIVAGHLETCGQCRQLVQTQTTARTVLKARAAQLSPVAPPGLRTRIAASAGGTQASAPAIGWQGHLSAFAAAAVVVLVLGAALLPAVTVRSTVLLAAQLALDHLKCFTIDGDGDAAPISKAEAEATLQREYALTVAVPPSSDAEGLELVAVRRCLYGDGRAAHLLYRLGGEPVSLFVIPGMSRPAAELSLLGHEQLVWTEGDRTYMLVSGAGTKAGLARIAPYLRNEAK
jgi:anti-sigma factor RsiW